MHPFAAKRAGEAVVYLLLLVLGSAQAFADTVSAGPVLHHETSVKTDAVLDKDGRPLAEPESQSPVSTRAVNDYVFGSAAGVALEDMSTGTTQLVVPNVDDTASAVTNIGFDIWFLGTRQTQFSVNANGLFRFGSTAVTTAFDNASASTGFASAANNPKLAPYFDDLWIGTNGRIHYKVVGTAPNRKLVVEWLNMQVPRAGTGLAGAATFQLWLSETTGAIQYVYGGGMAANAVEGGYSIGMANSAAIFASVTTATDTVSYVTANNTQSDAIASGDSYTFTPPVPTAPTGLNFTGVTAVGMTLNWTDSPDELGYVVYRSTDGVTYTLVQTLAQDSTSFPATGLSPSTTYHWRVVANSDGALSAPLAGTQATSPPGNIVSQVVAGNWSDPATWVGGVVPAATDHVTIADGAVVTIDTAAVAFSLTVGTGGSAAVLQWEQAAARTLVVGTFVTIGSNGAFHSALGGTVTTHVLTVGADLTNNGVLDFSTNGDTAGAGITFTGAASNTFGGSGSVTDVRTLAVNKVAIANVLTLNPGNFTVRGTVIDVAGFLTLTSGTLRIAGTFPLTNRVFTSATYSIPAAGGIWLDNPNVIVIGQAGGTTTVNNGLFRVSQGIYNIGVGPADGMGGGTGAAFVIEGGTVNASGRIDPQNAVSYSQSGGTVNVAVVGNSRSNFSSFELFSTASFFTMSGGTINIVNRNTGATQLDYTVRSPLANTSITGGQVVFGAGGAPSGTTFITTGGQIPSFTVNPTMTLNINNAALFMRGQTVDNQGTITYAGASARFDFASQNSAMSYGGGGVFGTAVTPVAGVGISANSLFQTTLNSAIFANRVNLFQGGFINSNQITLGSGGTSTTVVQIGSTGLTTPGGSFDVSPVHNQGSGGQILLYAFETAARTTGPEINPTRILTSINAVDNPLGVTIAGGDLTLTSGAAALVLNNGRLITGSNTLIMSSGSATVTRTNGWVDGNFRKTFAAAGSKTFEVGSQNGYSPVAVNATAGTFPGTATVRAVQGIAPNISPPDSAITRHWEVISTDVTSADLTFNYLDPIDIPGTVTEADLLLYRRDGGVFTDLGGTIDTGANTATATAVGTFGVFTLAEPGAVVVLDADLSITKDDGVTSVTPGGSTTYTIVAGNAGPSNVTGATVADTFPAELTCSWTCAGSGGGTCTAAGSGNINDVVNLPIGGSVTYTASCTISPSATGTIANTATVSLPGGFNDPDTGNNSATDTDTVGATADLAITKTDGVTSVVPGQPLTYTIVASNAGPSGASGATVADTFPAALTSCSWTCTGAGGGSCPANGTGNIGATVNLPAGGSTTFTANCTVSPSATGSIVNTATVAVPGGVTDPTPGNNSATDTDMVQATADVEALILNDSPYVQVGGQAAYTFVVTNNGPAGASSVTVNGGFPPALLANVAWTCSGLAGGVCGAPNGSGGLNDTANLPSGGSVTYAVTADVIDEDGNGNVMVMVQAFVGGGVTDPQPGNNEDQVSSIVVIFRDGFDEAEGDPDIVVFDNVNFLPPATFDGGSVRWDTGDTCACDDPPFNFNVWASGATLAFFWPQNSNNMEGGVSLNGTTYGVLASGATIGPSSTFLVSTAVAAAAPWRQAGGVDGYLGFRFRNPATSQINYGYVRIQTTGTGGFPATVVGWAYNQAGDPITIP